MKYYFHFILGFIMLSLIVKGQDYSNFAIDKIPDKLKENANVVVRKFETKFEILSSNSSREKIYKVKTIMNKADEHEAYMVVYYDNFRKIKKFNALTLNKNGKVIKKLKKTEIYDASIAQNSVDDSRIKAADMTYTEYPYTVIFDYEIDYDGLFYYPRFTPQFTENVSVQSASFMVTFPENKKPRYKELNIKHSSETLTSIYWEISNLPAFKKIPFSPNITDFAPIVLLAPADFELDGHKGNMTTWAGFAKWYANLNKDRDVLSEQDVIKAQEITQNLSTKEEKIKAIYEYMQSKTRYVSVQLGIGGYQTMPAKDVSENGWGDCKALSNYTKALLSTVGVDAYPTLVNAGRGAPNIIADFSSNQFNHVILCVPLNQDTVWLECTSREVPYNFLGSFTGDRDVLFINDKKGTGKIIHTPRYTATKNYRLRKGNVILDNEGNGTAEIETKYGGLSFDRLIPYLDESEEKLEKVWYEKINIPGFTIEDISFSYDKAQGPHAKQELKIVLDKYGSVSGKRFFFKPNLMNKNKSYPKVDEARELDVVTSSEYIDIDTIKYVLPDGFYPEHLPKDVIINTEFGSYTSTFTMDEKGLMYTRKLERKKGRFPKESFTELSEFLKKIKRADNQKVVLLGST